MKRMLSIALAVIMSCTVLAVNVFADHLIPGGQGQMCNNTYYYIEHIEHIGVGPIGSHIHTDGRTCVITGLTMRHAKKCASCHAIIGTCVKTCTESHSICGGYYKNCLQ